MKCFFQIPYSKSVLLESIWFILILSSLVTNQIELPKASYIFFKNNWLISYLFLRLFCFVFVNCFLLISVKNERDFILFIFQFPLVFISMVILFIRIIIRKLFFCSVVSREKIITIFNCHCNFIVLLLWKIQFYKLAMVSQLYHSS